MLEAAVAFFPLIASYTFCSNWRRLRYRLARLDSQKFYWAMASYAIFIGIIALLINLSLLRFDWFLAVIEVSRQAVGLEAGIPALQRIMLVCSIGTTLILGPIAAGLLNLLEWFALELRRYPAGYHATRKAVESDDFDLILFRAWSTNQAVMLTLANGKVYTGNVLRSVDPDEERKTIRLLPIISGFRDENHRVIFTTDYQHVIERKDQLDLATFEIAVVRAQIVTLGLFDFGIYGAFNEPEPVIISAIP